jgi:hypothetical protein
MSTVATCEAALPSLDRAHPHGRHRRHLEGRRASYRSISGLRPLR